MNEYPRGGSPLPFRGEGAMGVASAQPLRVNVTPKQWDTPAPHHRTGLASSHEHLEFNPFNSLYI